MQQVKRFLRWAAYFALAVLAVILASWAFRFCSALRSIRIEGSEILAPGSIGVYQLAGADCADWRVIPEAECYTDSNAGTFVITAPAGEYRIIAAAVRRGKAVIAEKSIRIGQGSDEESLPEPTDLQAWITQQKGKLSVEDAAGIESAFDETCLKIEAGEIETVAGALASVREGTLAIGAGADNFLNQLGEKIKAENPKSASEISKILRIFAPAKQPAEPAPEQNQEEKTAIQERKKYW